MKIVKVILAFVGLAISSSCGTLFSGVSSSTKILDVVAHPRAIVRGYNYGSGSATSQTHHAANRYNSLNHYVYQKSTPRVIKIIFAHPETHDHAASSVKYYKIINHGNSVNTAYNSHASNNFSKQLSALLPQILEIISKNHGQVGHYGQLIGAYGRSGKVTITANQGAPSADLHGGHVVERGVLEVTSLENGRIAADSLPQHQAHEQHHHLHYPASVNGGW